MKLTEIYRYPVKGLAPELLQGAKLKAGSPLGGDRQFALAHKMSDYDPANPAWIKRKNFVVVALSPKIASIQTSYDDVSGVLSMHDIDGIEHQFDLNSSADQQKLGALVEAYGGAAQPGPYTLAQVPGRHLTDRDTNWVSINCTASHKKVEEDLGKELSHRRWRGNLWIDNTNAFEEFGWVGKKIAIGETLLRVEEPIERCAATSANTETGERDVNMLQHFMNTYKHRNFGVFAEILQGGQINTGDTVKILEA